MHHDEKERRARLIGIAVATLVLLVTTVPAAIATPQKCRRTISKASAVFTHNELKASQRCEDAILRGKFAGPCPDQKATAKIAKLRAKLGGVIAAACGGPDKRCGVGNDDEPLPSIGWTIGICPDIAESGCSNTIDTCSGAGDCVRCVDEAATNATLDLAFDAFVLNTTDPAVRKCQRVIGKESIQFVAR